MIPQNGKYSFDSQITWLSCFISELVYGKFSYSKVSDKMAYANNAVQDQMAPVGTVLSGSPPFGKVAVL